ncbi:hypothetical protein Q7P37_005637 [Cladosporium fusiforme]
MSQPAGGSGSQRNTWQRDVNGREFRYDAQGRKIFRDQQAPPPNTADPRSPPALPANLPTAGSHPAPYGPVGSPPKQSGYIHATPNQGEIGRPFAALSIRDPHAGQPVSENARGKQRVDPSRGNQAASGINPNVENRPGAAANQPQPINESGMRSATTPKQQETLDNGISSHQINAHESDGLTSVDYQPRKYPRKYFQIGKVFLTVHTEQYGQTGKPKQGPETLRTLNNDVFAVAHGSLAFSKVRRFIVVREGGNSCQALAISTHSGQGARAPRNQSPDHGIVFTGSNAPQAFKHEKGILLGAIRVDPSNASDRLHVASRLNYGKVYNVEHNVEVKPYGIVNSNFMHLLYQQFTMVFFRTLHTTPVRTALSQPSPQTFGPLGFTEPQITAIINMINIRRAKPDQALSSVAEASAMPVFEGRDGQQRLARQAAKLVLAGLTFQQAIQQVTLVEGKHESFAESDDETADEDDDDEGGDEGDDDNE